MKKIFLIFVLVMILISCGVNTTIYAPDTIIYIDSESLFIINWIMCSKYEGELPVSIYNFNTFPITVNCNDVEYIIMPFDIFILK